MILTYDPLTPLQRDILIKAREGIAEGMWCRLYAFREMAAVTVRNEHLPRLPLPASVIELTYKSVQQARTANLSLDRLATMHRCATGELYLRTYQLGGNLYDYHRICSEVSELIKREANTNCSEGDDTHQPGLTPDRIIEHHNDACTLEAGGQLWAGIFDRTLNAN